jgi:glycerol-3-phosphate dehydrogenase
MNQEDANKYQLPPALLAAVQYALNHEMILSPVDYFTRRSGMTLFSIQSAREWAHPVTDYMADQLQWSDQQKKEYARELEASFNEASQYEKTSDVSESEVV